MQFGSLVNTMMNRAKMPDVDTIMPGDPATVLAWSDRYPATVVYVEPTRIGVQRDNERVVSGSAMDGSAKYEYERNTNNEIYHFDVTPDGFRHTEKTGRVFRRTKRRDGLGLIVGKREAYYDPSF